MPRRTSSPPRRATIAVDVTVLTVRDAAFAVLVANDADRSLSYSLPWGVPAAGEALDAAAVRIGRAAAGRAPSWIEQIGALSDRRRHPGGAEISVGFVALVQPGAEPPSGGHAAWSSVDALPSLPARHRALVALALTTLRAWMDRLPVAFHLLPHAFTLSELQLVYELLLERRLHKASFRRALDGAALVEPLKEWRSEGRGRPAQLYRYAPLRRRAPRRSVRFDLLRAD